MRFVSGKGFISFLDWWYFKNGGYNLNIRENNFSKRNISKYISYCVNKKGIDESIRVGMFDDLNKFIEEMKDILVFVER